MPGVSCDSSNWILIAATQWPKVSGSRLVFLLCVYFNIHESRSSLYWLFWLHNFLLFSDSLPFSKKNYQIKYKNFMTIILKDILIPTPDNTTFKRYFKNKWNTYVIPSSYKAHDLVNFNRFFLINSMHLLIQISSGLTHQQ